MISYKIDIMERLKDKGYSSYKLRQQKIFGEATMTKFRNKEHINFDNLDILCRLLDCQPGDIVDYIPDTITMSDKPSDENLKDEDAIRQRMSIAGIYDDMCKKGIINNADSDRVDHYIRLYSHSYYIIELLKHGVIERCPDGYKLITDTEADK